MSAYRLAELAGVGIAYLDEGEGDPVLLVHGFASTAMVNWGRTGWLEALSAAGLRAIAPDNRGHGGSARFYDPAAYAPEAMAADLLRLLDHLSVEQASVAGYSMGARLGLALADGHPDRVKALVLGGVGDVLVRGNPEAEAIAAALEAASLADVKERNPRLFRRFAEHTGSDLRALAACMRGQARGVPKELLGRLRVPIMVAVGSRDDLAGSPERLAEQMEGAEILVVPGADHMFAPGNPAFKAGVLDFLRRRS
ncbi:MAG: alpha/beta fold hydrolase [Bauldia sp.]